MRSPKAPRLRAILWLSCTLLAAGCTATVRPRFPSDVATAIRRQPMRHMETRHLVVYYPAGRAQEARRFAGHVDACADVLLSRVQLHNPIAERKMVVVMPELPLNNAYVQPPAIGEPVSVVPSFNTLDFQYELGLPPDPSFIGCHEITHYVHALQMGGFFWFINNVLGDILSPQIGLDSWFHEGLATYYETRLQPGRGRLQSPFWKGAFAAGVAGHRINGGDLSMAQRTFPYGNHYLTGSRFVEFLADRYGEDKLWRLIEVQGRSIFFPLWPSVRFWQAYGASLSTLVEQFAGHVAATYPVIERAAGQRNLGLLGNLVRYATAHNGTQALITQGLDGPALLEIRDPGDRVLRRRPLQDIVFPRRLLDVHVGKTSGLSLTADGAHVYFSVIDQGDIFTQVKLVHYDTGTDRLNVVDPDLGGPGGGITNDGRAFIFARADGDRHDLMERDMADGHVRVIAHGEPREYFSSPRPSPDGQRIATTLFSGNRLLLRILDRANGSIIADVPSTGSQALDPWWVDDGRIVFACERHERLQICLYDLAAANTSQVTHAPYLAMSPRTVGGELRFANREGWGWTLDAVALPPATLTAYIPQPAQPAALLPVAHAAAPPEPPAEVLSDQPAGSFDHFFFPQVRNVNLVAFNAHDNASGWLLAGGDRLGFHTWALSAAAQNGSPDHLSIGAAFASHRFAPFVIEETANVQSWAEHVTQNSQPLTIERRLRDFQMSVARPFFTHQASLSIHDTFDDRVTKDATSGIFSRTGRRLGGASANVYFSGIENTPYGGMRRSLFLLAGASYFPTELNYSGANMTDLRGQLAGSLPMPGFRRLTGLLSLRTRHIMGSSSNPLLTLGGTTPLGALYESRNPADDPLRAVDAFPKSQSQRFTEYLRGYEDLPIALNHVAIADAQLRYPVIFDRGFASTLGLLPSSFLRQLTLTAFGGAALDLGHRTTTGLHAAVGARASLEFLLGIVPLTLNYQFAQRLRDDHARLHLVGVGAGF